MKKLLFILLTLCFSYSFADSCHVEARTYVNTYITQNGVRSITGTIMNTALNKIINAINCVDTASSGGTVTSIATDNTLSGGTITTSGTLKVDTTVISTKGNVTGLLLGKQDNLVSATNIKTINSSSILGSGNIVTPDEQTLSISLAPDSISMTISGGNTIKFNYQVDSVSLNTNGDSLVVYKRGVRQVKQIAVGGSGTVTSVSALTLGTSGTDLSSTVANSTTTPVITLNVPTASASNRGVLSTADWSTFNAKQAALSSGTNIKTVNSTSLLGSGNIDTPDQQTLSSSYSDSVYLAISGGNTIGFAYAVDSVGVNTAGDSIITYKRGVRRSYTNGSAGGVSAVSIVRSGFKLNASIASTTLTLNSPYSVIVDTTLNRVYSYGITGLPTGATGTNVIAIGYLCSDAMTSGSNNVAIGYGSNHSVTTGSNNTAIGHLTNLVNNSSNATAIGYACSPGSNGGFAAGNGSTTSGQDGIAIGTSAGSPTGTSGIAIGSYSYSGTGGYTVAIGDRAGGQAGTTTGNNGIYIGNQTGFRLTSGSYNVFAGYRAADSATTANKSVAIGYAVELPSKTDSGQLCIQNIIYGRGNVANYDNISTGNIGIGVKAPAASAILDLTSTTRGFLPPRMTATQASAIASPAKGLMLYVTDTDGTFTSAGLWIYTTLWKLIIAE